jgi:hypothetical protein
MPRDVRDKNSFCDAMVEFHLEEVDQAQNLLDLALREKAPFVPYGTREWVTLRVLFRKNPVVRGMANQVLYHRHELMGYLLANPEVRGLRDKLKGGLYNLALWDGFRSGEKIDREIVIWWWECTPYNCGSQDVYRTWSRGKKRYLKRFI